MRIVFGIAAGLGNAVFCLPALKALWQMGHQITVYLDTDWEMGALFQRCRYLADVLDARRDAAPAADRYVSGPWCPVALRQIPELHAYTWTHAPPYLLPEWALVLNAARDLGWSGDAPDVSDWCARAGRNTLSAPALWDVALIPGCKPGPAWERKRYPHMATVAAALSAAGLRCITIGDAAEPPLPGAYHACGRIPLDRLPDVLARCRIVVGTDSGPTHLAASLGIPCVVLFTATSEVKGQPLGTHSVSLTAPVPCRPCYHTPAWDACERWDCREILPAAVIDAALRLVECDAATN